MINNYHDKDYDGVVLKIPSWFIKMNNLDDAFRAFQTALESAKKSMFYPDHQRNLYELKHAEGKIREVQSIREAQKQQEKATEERFSRIVKGEIYELEWVKSEAVFDGGSFFWDTKRFDYEDMFTKRGIKAEFEKFFREKVHDWKSFTDLYKCNGLNVRLHIDMEGADESFFDISNYSLYKSSYDELGISYQRLNVKYEWRKSKKNFGWRYRLYRLVKTKDGCLAINNKGTVEDGLRLERFEKSGLTLIKKQK